jgi:hypothetical protein
VASRCCRRRGWQFRICHCLRLWHQRLQCFWYFKLYATQAVGRTRGPLRWVRYGLRVRCSKQGRSLWGLPPSKPLPCPGEFLPRSPCWEVAAPHPPRAPDAPFHSGGLRPSEGSGRQAQSVPVALRTRPMVFHTHTHTHTLPRRAPGLQGPRTRIGKGPVRLFGFPRSSPVCHLLGRQPPPDVEL